MSFYDVEQVIENHIAVMKAKKCECGSKLFYKENDKIYCERCNIETRSN